MLKAATMIQVMEYISRRSACTVLNVKGGWLVRNGDDVQEFTYQDLPEPTKAYWVWEGAEDSTNPRTNVRIAASTPLNHQKGLFYTDGRRYGSNDSTETWGRWELVNNQ